MSINEDIEAIRMYLNGRMDYLCKSVPNIERHTTATRIFAFLQHITEMNLAMRAGNTNMFYKAVDEATLTSLKLCIRRNKSDTDKNKFDADRLAVISAWDTASFHIRRLERGVVSE